MTTSNSNINPAGQKDGIVLQGYHKKLKTMKKKYFVLYAEMGNNLPKLEYYDSEKKFKSRSTPKREIILRPCVNINRRLDTKHKFVIALSTRDDVFCIVLESEQELNTWLRAMLALQRGEDMESEPTFEHVWQVQVQRKGLAEEKGIIGSYHVCLTTKYLNLVRIGSRTTSLGEERLAKVGFYLTTIRRCGDSQCYFYMEVGRHSAIGAGELWMETEDSLIAQNMHTIIYNAMSSSVKPRDENFGGPMRRRSASANEASKPISMMQRRQTHASNKPMNSSPLSESTDTTSSSAVSSAASTVVEVPIALQTATSKPQEVPQTPKSTDILNSFPVNQQPDTINQQTVLPTSSSTRVPPVLTSTSCNPQYPFTAPLRPLESQRRHSVSAVSSVCHQRALSLPSGNSIVTNHATLSGVVNNYNTKKSLVGTSVMPASLAITSNDREHYISNSAKNTYATATHNINNIFTSNNHTILPIHQRTRSLPLTEETAIPVNDINDSQRLTNQQCICNLPEKGNIRTHSQKHLYRNTFNDSLLSLPTNLTSQNLFNNNVTNSNHTVRKRNSISYNFGIGSSGGSGNKEMNNNNNNKKKSNKSNNNDKNIIINTIKNHNNNNNHNKQHEILSTISSENITEDSETLVEALPNSKTIQNFIMKNLSGKHPKSSSFNQGGIKSSPSGGSPLLLRKGRVRSSRSTTLGRERCDSLPSRNRTASECSNQSFHNSSMPPPRTIPPLSNRPHSMYNNRHSHSPPINALSPSTGCSGSDGSLSTDETDSFGQSSTPDESGNFMRYYNPRGSDSVIPEENIDDCWYQENRCNSNENTVAQMNKVNNPITGLSLPISNQNMSRKGSPSAHLGSMESQGQYMDMFSPCGSSPCDQTGSGYLPFSPGVEYSRGLYPGSSGGHSRASSLAEETVDGYVPMAPLQSQDFIDVEQTLKQHHISSVSSAASSGSITSGTPSTDLRFAEYPLDKVKSRFTPDDEDANSPNNRPLRAYSVGSRLEHNKRKLRVDMMNMDQNNSRERAFSVGSKTKVPRSELFRGIFASSLMSCHVTNNNTITNLETNANVGVIKGKKSSSAPMLVHKSHSSVDRMGDLMEIDYSKNSESENSSSLGNNSSTRTSSFPVSVPSSRPKYDSHYNNSSPRTYTVPGYVDMKPGSLSEKFSPTTTQKSIDSGYLEMRPIGLSKSPSLSSSPIKNISLQTSAKFNNSPMNTNKENDYMNMSTSSGRTARRISCEEYLNVSLSDDHFEDKILEVDDIQTPTSNIPEGYMEMSWNKSKSHTGNKEFSTRLSNYDADNLNDRNNETRLASSPIDIVGMFKNKNSGSRHDTYNEEYRIKCDDTEPMTPSTSHSTIFPFSPGSPKSFAPVINDFAQRKCLVDATSGTVTLQSETSKNGNNEKTNATKITNKGLIKSTSDVSKKLLNGEKTKTFKSSSDKVDILSKNYADMSLKSKEKCSEVNTPVGSPDYVNIEIDPKSISSTRLSNDTKNLVSEQINVPKTTPSVATASNKKSLLVTINPGTCYEKANNLQGFKPIASSTDEIFIKNKNESSSNTKKISSPKSTICNYLGNATAKLKVDDNSGYELLQMRSDSSLQTKRILSRPNSVNSDKISPTKNLSRPNSANSEILPSVSSSTSTLCGGSSSSSSTLCGSKSQSPLSISRPQSFSDTTTVSRPESVASLADPSISSRPPSVSSERELHYASLVLPPSSNNEIIKNLNTNSNSNAKVNSSTSGESSSPSPNGNGCQQQSTFTYAQIDFNKI